MFSLALNISFRTSPCLPQSRQGNPEDGQRARTRTHTFTGQKKYVRSCCCWNVLFDRNHCLLYHTINNGKSIPIDLVYLLEFDEGVVKDID
jgi:hypothetical protein